MKSLILFLALVCGGVSFLVYTDNQFVSGNWAGQICRSAGALCHNPQLLAFAAAGLLALCNPAPRAINPNSTSALSSRTGTPRSSRTGTATPMVTRSASDLYGIRMTSEISNLGRVSEFSSYRTLSERLGRTSILDSSDTLAPSINKFDPRLFKILQNPDLFENAAAKAATPAAPASSMATELASLGAAKDVAKEMASPSADIGSDPLFHFSVLSGKLEMGLVANYKYLGIKGGEINIYRWGAAGAGAIYCESRECVAELMKKAAEADELFHPKKQEKAPTNLPEKVELPN